jgi:hypothetical protein
VAGRCRWVTSPATSIRRSVSNVRSSREVNTPRASSADRKWVSG